MQRCLSSFFVIPVLPFTSERLVTLATLTYRLPMARTASSITIMTEELDEEVLDSLAEIEKLYTVFDGASQEDVAYAKVFWNSLSLQPPIESRLVSADIRQRLNVAKTPHCKCNVK